MVETAPYPRCQRLSEEIVKKSDGNGKPWNADKVAMLLRVRFNRTVVRSPGGTEQVTGEYIRRLFSGKSYAPDTLRAQIASILGVRHKDAFPEYLIACETLKAEREKRGWTQAHVAKELRRRGRKVRDAEISSFECGGKYCHPETREKIARVFEMDDRDLFPEYCEGVAHGA